MEILVVSDIHGNKEAFMAVLEKAKGMYSGLLCLGDTTGYGPDSPWCIERLRSLQDSLDTVHILAGNHDAALTGLLPLKWFNKNAQTALKRTARVLSEADKAWLAGLTGSCLLSDSVLAVHGSPLEPLTGYLTGGYETLYALSYLADRSLKVCFAGHTHSAVLYRANPLSPVIEPYAGLQVDLENTPLIINPGSVGFPRSFGTGRNSAPPSPESYPAYFALWNPDAETVRFLETRYDRRPVEVKIARWGKAL